MSYVQTAARAHALPLDPNRNDTFGLAASVFLAMAGLVAVQAGAGLAGITPLMLAHARVAGLLPVSLAHLLPLLLFPCLGMARWAAWQAGRRGRAASWWIVALMGATLGYPFAGLVLDSYLMNWMQLALLLLAGATALRVSAVSRAALIGLLPSLLVLVVAAIPGYVALTGGWSPGLAITVVMAHPERI
jgi:hypothetical protein